MGGKASIHHSEGEDSEPFSKATAEDSCYLSNCESGL